MAGNPMRWKCGEIVEGTGQGCFNLKKRPKIEVFHDCFKRGINFGDVDGVVERNGCLLFLEFKPAKGIVPRGQQMLHDALVSIPRVCLMIVVCDAETMAVTHFTIRRSDIPTPFEVPANLDQLKEEVRRWYEWADAQPPRPGP